MKNFLIILFLLLTINLYSNELAWVDEQVEAIKPPRKGVNISTVSKLKNPFVFLNKNNLKSKKKKNIHSIRSKYKKVSSSSKPNTINKVTKRSFILSAIINNSALINNKWYKLGDMVKDYKLTKINGASIILAKGKSKLLLSTNSRNLSLKFKNK